MANRAEEEPNNIDPRGKKQAKGASFAMPADRPEMIEEVEWDENDRTCAWVEWKGTETTEQERYKIVWWTDETDKREDETNARKYPLSKLKEGATYFVCVCQFIDGRASDPSDAIKFGTGPSMPGDIQVSNHEPSPHDHLLVKFKNSNKRPVEHLVMVQSISGEEIAHIKVKGGQNFALVKNLNPGQCYGIQVAALIGELMSDSATFPEMVQTYPGIPVGVGKEGIRNGVKLRWNHLKIKPKKYLIYWEANGKNEITETTENHFSFTNLEPSTIYKFRVSAVNDAGEGEKSEEVEHITAPAAPTNITVAPNPRAKTRSLIVKYEDPDPVLKKTYQVTANGVDGKVADEVLSEGHCAVLKELTPGQAYYITVVAIYGELRSPEAHYAKQNN